MAVNLAMAERDNIFQDVSRELQSLFEISEQDITLDARLYEDLDLDSIDAALNQQLRNPAGRSGLGGEKKRVDMSIM